MNNKLFSSVFILFIFQCFSMLAQNVELPAIPKIFSKMSQDEKGKLFLNYNSKKLFIKETPALFTSDIYKDNVIGTSNGLAFDFHKPSLNGTLYYGFIPYNQKYEITIFFRLSAKIENGKATVDLKSMGGNSDIVDWETTGKLRLGYRIVTSDGKIIYDGKINIKGKGPFETDLSIVEGPFINNVSEQGAVISFETNKETDDMIKLTSPAAQVLEFSSLKKSTHHEVLLKGLKPATTYDYEIHIGANTEKYSFTTSPILGTRKPFCFAYASDSRKGLGGGERDIYGTNAYMMKRVAVMATQQNSVFMQFTGDMINGYTADKNSFALEFSNWKRSIEPFAHYVPVYVAPGNHECIISVFSDSTGKTSISTPRFPFTTESSESVFASMVVNPENGPASEDGSKYDPNLNAIDFPSYKENVYTYTYDNVAMIVLNSDYLYTPELEESAGISGNLHAYLMDNQINWLKQTLQKYENNNAIDHVFISLHTPIFPNGGHSGDDMWYGGNNNLRPVIAGKPVDKGIIERRDEILDLLANKNQKVVAVFCGDEHNYSRMIIDAKTVMYPPNYIPAKISITRPIWQITNGAAGAPYYGQENLLWSENVKKFSNQNSLVFIHVDGKKINLEVLNPDTFEVVDKEVLR